MGDRTYLHIALHGTIATVAMFNGIIDALNTEGLHPDDDSGDIAAHLIACAKEGKPAGFHDHECNYAEIEGAEAILRDLGVPYFVEHESGGGYSAGCWTWTPDGGFAEAEITGDGPSISAEELRKALAALDPIAAASAILAEIDKAGGADLPQFAISQDVLAELEAQ